MNKKLTQVSLLPVALLSAFVILQGCSSRTVKLEQRGIGEKMASSLIIKRPAALSPSGKYAALARGNSIDLMDPLTSNLIRKLTFKDSSPPLSLAFSPDDKFLAVGTLRKIYLWDMELKKVVELGDAHRDGVVELAFSNGGGVHASASKGSDRDITLWRTNDWTHIRSLDMAAGGYSYANNVQAMEFSPDDTYIAATGLDRKIRIWSVKTGKGVQSVENPTRINALSFGGGGHTLASGDDGGQVKLWDVKTGMNIRTIKADSKPITALSFHSKGKLLASASRESRILRLWNTDSWDYERETIVSSSERSLLFDRSTLAGVAFGASGVLSLYPLMGEALAYHPISTAGGIPPIISILAPLPLSEVDSEKVRFSGLIRGAAKIESVEVYVNGRVIPDSTRDLTITPSDEKSLPFTYLLALPREGENEIKVIARDSGGLESSETVQVTRNSQQGQVWGAVIGVSEYQDPSINDLRYAASDARAFYTYMRDDFGVPEENLFALYDEEATIKNIRDLLGVKLKNKARKKDTVIIFYAGHGAPELDSSVEYEDGLEKYFLPHDSAPDSLYSTAFPMKEVENIIGRIRAERVAFIADTCFSGASDLRPGRTISTSRRTRSLSSKDYFKWASRGKGRVVLTASDANERSIEDDSLKHGLFTYYLLEALRGAADSDQDGVITADEAYKYTSIKVSDASNQEQNPTKKGDVRGQIILGKFKIGKEERRER